MKRNLTLTNLWLAMVILLALGLFVIMRLALRPPSLWAGAMIAILGALTAVIASVYPKRVKAVRFMNRPLLTDQEIYAQFYAESGIPRDRLLKEWHHASKLLLVPSGLLRPNDYFDGELAPVPGWHFYDDGADFLILELRRRLHRPADGITKFKTLDEYIKKAASAEQ